jgi:hypothetical protein
MVEDHSLGRSDYIYSVKTSTPKDANTLLSQIHATIRRSKSSYDHPSYKARKLVCIADSAGENKNNTVLAYFTDLVDNGWFDVVELLFGPVGHTHNGVDATHKIHNQNVGNCTSGDLGHFVQNYPKGFSGKDTLVPDASILAKTLNWKDYYKPHMSPLAGFAKSKNDPVAVRGFRIEREKTGTVSIRWKVDPALEQEWRGEDGFPGTTGFHVLKSAPEGLPDFVVPTKDNELSTKSLNKLRNQNMFEVLDPQGPLHVWPITTTVPRKDRYPFITM